MESKLYLIRNKARFEDKAIYQGIAVDGNILDLVQSLGVWWPEYISGGLGGKNSQFTIVELTDENKSLYL
jgi:hypothetical protein